VAAVDVAALAAHYGVKHDDEDPAVKKVCKEMDKKKEALITALLTRVERFLEMLAPAPACAAAEGVELSGVVPAGKDAREYLTSLWASLQQWWVAGDQVLSAPVCVCDHGCALGRALSRASVCVHTYTCEENEGGREREGKRKALTLHAACQSVRVRQIDHAQEFSVFVCVYVCVCVYAVCPCWQGYDEKVRYARLLSGVRRRQERPGAAGAELLKV